jgi:hypothetical protein
MPPSPRHHAADLVRAWIHRQDTQPIRDAIIDPISRRMAEQHARNAMLQIQSHARQVVADSRYAARLPPAMRSQVETFMAVRGHRTNERLRNAHRQRRRPPE